MTSNSNLTYSGSKLKLYAYCTLIIVVWGTAYTMIGFAVDSISPAWIAASRTVTAALFLIIYVFLRGRRFPPLRDPAWRWYTALGFFGIAGPFYLIARGQVHVDSGLAGILAGFMPLITIALAHFLVKGEQLNLRKSLGFLMGFVGLIILFLPDTNSLELVSNWRSQALIVLAATCYAIATIIAKKAPEVPASVGAAMMVIMGALFCLILALMTGLPSTLPPVSAMLAILGLALGSTCIANILFLRLIQETGPSFVARINYLVPLCSVGAGIIFLGEGFQIRTAIALVVIIAGLIIAGSGDKTKTEDPLAPQTD